ncbi:MAG: ABC transporter ATP-binding protein [Thaumarchaeota archaeon]|nr:ABC transporter ATP-binding protein [Nitrososphaerota archaeon]
MPETVIKVENLVKRYGELVAVDHVSFEVSKGEIFAFLGPNGAGKTTTVEIIECLRPLTQGTVQVLGMNIVNGHDVSRIKEKIGVLPQDFSALDRLTVRENLTLFAKMYEKPGSVVELMDLLGLTDKSNARFGSLSGGLKQRVGVAAALVNNPDLVFLDEPTTGLDPEIRRTTWNVISGLKRSGRTIFLTTHYMEEAQFLADRIGIIVKGKIAAIGTPTELMERYGGRKVMVFKNPGEQVFAALRADFEHVQMRGTDCILPFTRASEIQEALTTLSQRGLSTELEVKSPTIEDVFLKLTGFTITQGGEAA